jgi:hypothetical protein
MSYGGARQQAWDSPSKNSMGPRSNSAELKRVNPLQQRGSQLSHSHSERRMRGGGGDSFNVNGNVLEREIPSYDARNDRNCPFTHTNKFRASAEKSQAMEERARQMARELRKRKKQHSRDKPSMNSDMEHSRGHKRRVRGLDAIEGSMKMVDSTSGGGSSLLGGNESTGASSTNMSTESGGITWSKPPTYNANPEQELEVLKAILLREQYLQRLKNFHKGYAKTGVLKPEVWPVVYFGVCGLLARERVELTCLCRPPYTLCSVADLLPYPKVTDLLDLVRVGTVEVVEAIVLWRQGQARSHPFIWNGINYLVKIPSDLDFLDGVGPITEWLGFRLHRNPFVVPIALDARAQTPTTPVPQTSGSLTADRVSLSASNLLYNDSDPTEARPDQDFVEIGGREMKLVNAAHPSYNPLKQSLRDNQEAKGVGSTANPYNTPVLNDREMQPNTGKTRALLRSGSGTRAPTAERRGQMSSHVGSLDLMRVRDAEKTILMEEELHGKYLRDQHGRIIPEVQARKEKVALSYLGGGDEVTMRHAPKPRTESGNWANGPMSADPFETDMSVLSVDPLNQAGDSTFQVDSSGLSLASMKPSGRQRAQKRGGALTPLTTAATVGRAKAPRMRGVGSRMDEDIRTTKQQNEKLAGEISRLKDELANERFELDQMEEVDLTLDSATKIQAQYRGNKDRDKADEEKKEMEDKLKDLEEQEKVLLQKQAELEGKEEERNAFRHNQKKELDQKRAAEIEKKRAQLMEGGVLVEDEISSMTLEDKSARHLQRRYRGILGRRRYRLIKYQYTMASMVLQGMFRGWKARLSVSGTRLTKKAVIMLQRCTRGMLGRKIADWKRAQLYSQSASTYIEAWWRGYKGRVRMRHKRRFVKAATSMRDATLTMTQSSLRELARACYRPHGKWSPPPQTILSLLLCIRSMTAVAPEAPPTLGMDFEEAAAFARRSNKLLRRLQRLSSEASFYLIDLRQDGLKLIKAMLNDPLWNCEKLNELGAERGGVCCSRLLKWLEGLVVVHELQHEFIGDTVCPPEFDDRGDLEGPEEIVEDEIEDREAAAFEVRMVRQFVPERLLVPYKKRPRPVLLAVARDIPSTTKKVVLERLMANLPGMFARAGTLGDTSVQHSGGNDLKIKELRRKKMIESLQNIFDVGMSAIVDVDVGIGNIARNAFVQEFTTIRSALRPIPYCVLFQGHKSNRHGSGADVRLGVDQDDLSMMGDAVLKQALQDSAEALHSLTDTELQSRLKRWSTKKSPPHAGMVLVMEAMIVLLTPTKRFKGPSSTVRSVSWEVSRAFLKDPQALAQRLEKVDMEKIPPANLAALHQYLMHPEWPTDGQLSVTTPSMRALWQWVVASVIYAERLQDQGGPGKILSRRYPAGVFASVVSAKDMLGAESGGSTGLKESDEPDHEERGWKAALNKLLVPILEDVRIYREARKINSIHHLCGIFRDCGRFFFSLYDPNTSIQRVTLVPDSQINALLAPNSIESRDRKDPPETLEDMYSRLVQLCSLEKDRRTKHTVLVCRRSLTRMMRETRRVCGHLVTITVSEEARAVLRIDAYVPSIAQQLTLLADPNSIAPLIADAERNGDADEAEKLKSEIGWEMLLPVVDRLQVIDPAKSDIGAKKRTRAGAKKSEVLPPRLTLALRKRGGAGREVRKWSARIGRTKKLYQISLFQISHSSAMRLVLYNPQNSNNLELRLTKRERLELMGFFGPEWQLWWPDLLKRIRLKEIKKSGTKSVSGKTNEIVVLDRTVYKECRKIGEHGRTRYSTIIVQIPEETKEHDWMLDTAATMHTYKGGLEIFVYFADSSGEFHIILSDEEVMSLMKTVKAWEEAPERRMAREKREVEEARRLGEKYLAEGRGASSDPKPYNTTWPVESIQDRNSAISVVLSVIHYDDEKKKLWFGIGPKEVDQPFEVKATRLLEKRCEFAKSRSRAALAHERRRELEQSRRECLDRKLQTDLADEVATAARKQAHVARVAKSTEDANECDNNQELEALIEASRVAELELQMAEEAYQAVEVTRKKIVSGEIGCLAALQNTKATVEDKAETINAAIAAEIERKNVRSAAEAIREREGATTKPGIVFSQACRICGRFVVLTVTSGIQTKEDIDRFTHSYAAAPKPLKVNEVWYLLRVYSPNTSFTASIEINGTEDLREVAGASVDESAIIDASRKDELWAHICHNRLQIADGVWDSESDSFNVSENPSAFSLKLLRDRLFDMTKVTPAHMVNAPSPTERDLENENLISTPSSGLTNADTVFNQNLLIDRRYKRGLKLFSRPMKINNRQIIITMFDQSLPGSDGKALSLDDLTIRVQGYVVSTSQKMLLILDSNMLLKAVVKSGKISAEEQNLIMGDQCIFATTRRAELANLLLPLLRLQQKRDGSLELILPSETSDEVDDVQRPHEERTRKRPGKMCVFGLRVEKRDIVVNVFLSDEGQTGQPEHKNSKSAAAEDAERLIFNIYDRGICESCEIILEGADVEALLGRPMKEIKALPKQDQQGSFKTLLHKVKMWHYVHKDYGHTKIAAEIDTPAHLYGSKGAPQEKIMSTGAPDKEEVATLADVRGPLLLRKGMTINDMYVIVNIRKLARHLPAKNGVVIEVYNPLSCQTASLSLRKDEIARHVEGRYELIEQSNVVETLRRLCLRLQLRGGGTKPSP